MQPYDDAPLYVALSAGDALPQIRAAAPDYTIAITGDLIREQSFWRSICHSDGTSCDWRSAPLEEMRSSPGEIHQQCCHGKDCVVQQVVWEHRRVKVYAA